MSQQNNQQFARRPKSMLSDFRYPLPRSDKPFEGSKYPATWNWELGLSGQVFMKINDGKFGKDDPNAKLKEVELGWADRNALFNLIENAINDENFGKGQYHVKKVQFGSSGRLNDFPSTLATFTVIRDSAGKIHVGYTKGTYKIMFTFTSPNESVILFTGKDGGEPQPQPGLMSRCYAKAFIDHSRKFLDQYEWDNYKEKEKKGDNNNNGGGRNNWGGGNNNNNNNNNNNSGWNGNSNNNGGGGNSQPSMPDFDDDIAF